jgi:Na+-translocating ferredoxin:NAD+ oxidoreductase RnfG subunit
METKFASRSHYRRWQRWGMAVFRLAIIAAAMLSLAQRGPKASTDLARFRQIAAEHFPSLVRLGAEKDGWYPMLGADDEVLGWLTSTSPQGDGIVGYAGPSDLLILLDATRHVRAVRLLHSADTVGHVAKVQQNSRFWAQWHGQNEAALGRPDEPVLVSGASLTSEAMTRAVAARFGAKQATEFFPRELALQDVSAWFPQATQLQHTKRQGVMDVWHKEQKIGVVLRSTRMGVNSRGFQGASDVLVALNERADVVRGVALLDSRDNQPYWGDVQDELRYADGFADVRVDRILSEQEHGTFVVVSGASMTARGLFVTVQEMLRRHQATEHATAWSWANACGVLWLLGGGIVAFRGGKTWRIRFAVASVIAGLTLGWMLGQDQLINWARYGGREWPAWPLLTMTAIALLVPSLTGKNVYCAHLCPHGAAQTLIGQWSRRRGALPSRLHRILVLVPWLTLVSLWGLAWWGSSFAFSDAEPFEVWSTGFVAWLPAVLFTAGLVASFFLPQAYCHYGCPTGALLKFLTHAPGRWTRRDSVALFLVALAWILSLR